MKKKAKTTTKRAKRKSAKKPLRKKTARSTRDGAEKMRKPVKVTRKALLEVEQEEGPAEWLMPDLESAYTRLVPRGAAPPVAAPVAVPRGGTAFASALQPGSGEEVFAEVPSTLWQNLLSEYKQRKVAAQVPSARAGVPAAPAPFVPGGRNWGPLGPTVVLKGQTVGKNPVGGRTSGLVVAPDGQRVYAATACGGVFRSDNAGTTWQSLMDGFDVNPTDFASSSLACGAIALDSTDPNRVYVGTGEGDTHSMFGSRVVNALPAYRGIGPIRTDDGGQTWVTEGTAAASPSLAGEAFFSLAVDPGNRDHVMGATTGGLYQRRIIQGSAEWVQCRSGVYCSVVVAAGGGVTRFFAAEWGVGVFQSTDGANWTKAGTGLPAGLGRIALGVQPSNPDVLYAFIANANGVVHGLFRLNGSGTAWKRVTNVPDVLPASGGRSQGDYDLAIAVDPVNVNLLYLGGSYADQSPFPGSVWRCTIQQAGSGYKVKASASIGTHAHADVHVLTHSPGDPNMLWCGCDGGVFLNRDPRGTGEFASQNTGLACLCSNFIAQHPTDPGILFTGLQDNGTARTDGNPMWRHVNYGDGGYCVINWDDPQKVLVFANGTVYRSTTGGDSHDAWQNAWNFPWATMTQPICTPPRNPPSPADADVVAVAAGTQVSVSDNFAKSWPPGGGFTLPAASGSVFALNFASRTRLFVGTTRGRVFRADRGSGAGWTVTRIDDAAAGPLGLVGLITDVAIDWSDASGQSVYVCFGGSGDARRVWWYDGANARWEVRSGPPGGNCLLDVEHNALVVDPTDPNNVYAGADIGVWHSADRGQNWQPLENGLPDSPVFDLQIHPTQRLLRAATHGRGVYEIALP